MLSGFVFIELRHTFSIFLEPTPLFSNCALLLKLVISHIWFIDKLDRHTAERFISEHVLNGNRTVDVVQV